MLQFMNLCIDVHIFDLIVDERVRCVSHEYFDTHMTIVLPVFLRANYMADKTTHNKTNKKLWC